MTSELLKQRGLVYVVWGKDFVEEAAVSARRIKQIDNLPCVLITTGDVPPLDDWPFEQTIVRDFQGTYRDKIAMRLSPFAESMFLDSDTYPVESVIPLFALLARFDVAFQAATGGVHYAIDDVPIESFPEPSAGLLLWKKNRATDEFFDRWESAYDQQVELYGAAGAWDQRSMRAALWSSDVRLTMLQGEWQLYTFAANVLLQPAKIIHGRGPAVAQALTLANGVQDYRVYLPRIGSLPLHRTRARDYATFMLQVARMTLRTTARSLLHHSRIWPRPSNKRMM